MTLKIEALYKRFPNAAFDTLHNINVEIQHGEFVCVIGPSGCGKSTLLNLLAGLEFPTAGQILLDGAPIVEAGADRVVMFQESALFPWLSVIDNVKFGLKMARLPKAEQQERAMHYLKLVHLERFSKYRPHELSGGMKQRVALARALALESKILLMDEPFAALDKQTKNRLRDDIQEIWMKTKKTVVFITHSVEEAIFFADRILMMSTNPGMVMQDMHVDIPRPRHIEVKDFIALRADLLRQIRNEVEKFENETFTGS